MLLVAADEEGPLVLAAGSSRGLFASPASNAGWRRLISDDVQITALAMIEAGDSSYAVAGDSRGGIWKSSTSLDDWRRVARHDNVGAITSFAQGESRGQSMTWLTGTEQAGLLLMSDDGAVLDRLSRQWPDIVEDCAGRSMEPSIPDQHIRDISSADGGSSIFVTTWNRAVYVSEDAGKTWSVQDQGLRCNVQADSAGFSTPHFRDLDIGGGNRQDWFLASFEGLFRSGDGGTSWVQLETMPVSLVRGLAVSPAIGSDHAIILTTYGGGAYISPDRGRSWAIANHGLASTRLADAEFAPTSQGDFPVFALSRERLLARDGTAGAWSVNSLVYRGWRRSVGGGLERYLKFSSEYGKDLFLSDSERLGIWPMQVALSPAFAEDQTMLLGFRRQGVWISDDGGASWDREWEGPRDYVTDLKVSPDFSNDRTAFAGLRGAGIYATRDGAKTWQAQNSGFRFFEHYAATSDPNHFVDPPLSRAITDVSLAVSPRFAEDLTVFAGSAAGLFRSTDGGHAWQALTVEPSVEKTAIAGIAVSPAAEGEQMLIASIKGRGIFRSTDAGRSFEPVGRQLLHDNVEFRFIRFSPSFDTDNTIYGASDWDLWVSGDRGTSWTIVLPPVRYEDWRGGSPGPLWFSADWSRETGTAFSASTQTTSDKPGASVSLNFVGDSIVWQGERGPSGGMARVVIDGVEAGTVDLYSDSKASGVSIFSVSDLPDKPHNVVIEVLDEKNSMSNGRRVTVDNVDVMRR